MCGPDLQHRDIGGQHVIADRGSESDDPHGWVALGACGNVAPMPTFMCIAYGEPTGADLPAVGRRSQAGRMDACRLGHDSIVDPLVGRPHDFTSSAEPGTRARLSIADMSCIDAADMEDAVRLVSETPMAALHDLIEVWPLEPHAAS